MSSFQLARELGCAVEGSMKFQPDVPVDDYTHDTHCYACGEPLPEGAVPLYTTHGIVYSCSTFCHQFTARAVERRVFPPS